MTLPKPKKVDYKKKAWDAFSLYIRARDKECQFHLRCKMLDVPAPCKCAGVLQACHMVSRKDKALLFDEDNVFAGCSASNTWAHWNQLKWEKLWRALWSENVAHIDRIKGARCQRKQSDYKNIAEWYTRELKRLT